MPIIRTAAIHCAPWLPLKRSGKSSGNIRDPTIQPTAFTWMNTRTLPPALDSMIRPLTAAAIRRPDTANSRHTMHSNNNCATMLLPKKLLPLTSAIMTPMKKTLLTTESINRPNFETLPDTRARMPVSQLTSEAMTINQNASESAHPRSA